MAEENDNLKKGLYLIGIGPGDVGLLTNEAVEIAKHAIIGDMKRILLRGAQRTIELLTGKNWLN